ncbi:antibiotic biosynthesis monooxygenase family protein [Foetidibacter luteolus]|uniref:antibiotic biosynthesis monooxygenase family protein n=1 Tax=Foetidibacter luteolus TaxID=2608880 RepID=UPI00129A33BF|nr:antibiotic biosynthesis monooxygenase [Foetidibacter luteolus]
MFARLTHISVQPDKKDEMKRIFNEEIVPVVKAQRGNIGIWLLEPTDENEDYISLTEWVSSTDADMYETNGTYRQLVDKVKGMYLNRPILKTYNISETRLVVPV